VNTEWKEAGTPGQPCSMHEHYRDGCQWCEAYHQAVMAEHLAEYIAASPSERLRVIDPEAAREQYRQDLRDAGRGHLIREDD
jgi:hypothetical protein